MSSGSRALLGRCAGDGTPADATSRLFSAVCRARDWKPAHLLSSLWEAHARPLMVATQAARSRHGRLRGKLKPSITPRLLAAASKLQHAPYSLSAKSRQTLLFPYWVGRVVAVLRTHPMVWRTPWRSRAWKRRGRKNRSRFINCSGTIGDTHEMNRAANYRLARVGLVSRVPKMRRLNQLSG